MSYKVVLVLIAVFLAIHCSAQSSEERGLSLSIIPHNFINAGMIDVDYNKEFVDFRENTVYSGSTGVGYYWKKNKWTYQVGSNLTGLRKQIYINTRLWDFYSSDSETTYEPIENDIIGYRNFEQWRLGLFFNVSRSVKRFDIGAGISITGLLNASFGYEYPKDYTAVASYVRDGVILGGTRSVVKYMAFDPSVRATLASLTLMYSVNSALKLGVSSTFWINALRFEALVYDIDILYQFEEVNGRRFDEASILNLTVKDPTFQAGFFVQYLIPFRKKGGNLEN
jgi:hypothetical protein